MPISVRVSWRERFFLSLMLLAIVAVWGWTFVLVKDAVHEYGVMPFLAVRFVIGAICMGAVAGRHVSRESLRTGGVIGVVLALAYLFQTLGLDRTTASNAGLITGLFVVVAPIANHVLFGVRTGSGVWCAIGMGLVGLGLLTGANPTGVVLGDVIAVGGAIGFGLHVALLDRHSKQHRADVLAFGQVATAALIFVLAWLVVGPLRLPPPAVWPALFVTGCIATAAAFLVQTFVQQRLPAAETAMVILTEPLFAVAFGHWLHGDRLTGVQMLGAATMVLSLLIAELRPFRSGRSTQ